MKKNLMISVIIFIIPVISGCNVIPDRYAIMDSNKGKSYETARYNQTLNLDAENNIDPVEGVDGNAAVSSIDKYQKGFKKEQSTTNVFNIYNDK